jgi:hypothetical protein
MRFKDIVYALIGTYKKIDIRLVTSKSEKGTVLAFLKILFSRDQNIVQKDIGFFNSLSSDLIFSQSVLDIDHVHCITDNLQKGTLEINKQSYSISQAEHNYFQGDIPTDTLYSVWT